MSNDILTIILFHLLQIYLIRCKLPFKLRMVCKDDKCFTPYELLSDKVLPIVTRNKK